jgi:hypothetical protein
MTGSPKLSTKVKGRIIDLHEGEMTPYEIVAKLNILQSTTCSILKNFQPCGIAVSPKSPGRPYKLHMQKKRQIGHLLT